MFCFNKLRDIADEMFWNLNKEKNKKKKNINRLVAFKAYKKQIIFENILYMALFFQSPVPPPAILLQRA